MADEDQKQEGSNEGDNKVPADKEYNASDIAIGGTLVGLGVAWLSLILLKGSQSEIAGKIRDAGGDIVGKIIVP